MENDPVMPLPAHLKRVTVVAWSTCASYRAAVDTNMGGASATRGRVTNPIASSLACRAVAVAYVGCTGYTTTTGMGIILGWSVGPQPRPAWPA